MKSFNDRKEWILKFIENNPNIDFVTSFSKNFMNAYAAFSGAVVSPCFNERKIPWCRTLSHDLSKMVKLSLLRRRKVYDDYGWFFQYFY